MTSSALNVTQSESISTPPVCTTTIASSTSTVTSPTVASILAQYRPTHSTCTYTRLTHRSVIYSDDPKSVHLPRMQLKSKAVEKKLVERLCGYLPSVDLIGGSSAAGDSPNKYSESPNPNAGTINNDESSSHPTKGGELIMPKSMIKWLQVLEQQRKLKLQQESEQPEDQVAAEENKAKPEPDEGDTSSNPLQAETLEELKELLDDFEFILHPSFYDLKRKPRTDDQVEEESGNEAENTQKYSSHQVEDNNASNNLSLTAIEVLKRSRRKLPSLTEDEVEDLVTRLYTQDLQHRRQLFEKLRQQQLHAITHDHQSPTKKGLANNTGSSSNSADSALSPHSRQLTMEEVVESATRLATSDVEQRKDKLQALIQQYYGNVAEPTVILTPSQLEESIQRIYYDCLAKHKQRRAELSEKYSFYHERQFPRLTAEAQKQSASRLTKMGAKRKSH